MPAPALAVSQAVVDSIRGRRNALAGTVRSVLLQAEALVPPGACSKAAAPFRHEIAVLQRALSALVAPLPSTSAELARELLFDEFEAAERARADAEAMDSGDRPMTVAPLPGPLPQEPARG
jgi:hypothetical protein